LTEKIGDLHKIANALLEFETLSGDEVKALLRGEKIVRNNEEKTPPLATTSSKRGSVPAASGDAKPLTPVAPITV